MAEGSILLNHPLLPAPASSSATAVGLFGATPAAAAPAAPAAFGTATAGLFGAAPAAAPAAAAGAAAPAAFGAATAAATAITDDDIDRLLFGGPATADVATAEASAASAAVGAAPTATVADAVYSAAAAFPPLVMKDGHSDARSKRAMPSADDVHGADCVVAPRPKKPRTEPEREFVDRTVKAWEAAGIQCRTEVPLLHGDVDRAVDLVIRRGDTVALCEFKHDWRHLPYALGQILCYAEKMRHAVVEKTGAASPFAKAEKAGLARLFVCIPTTPDSNDEAACKKAGVEVWVEDRDPLPEL